MAVSDYNISGNLIPPNYGNSYSPISQKWDTSDQKGTFLNSVLENGGSLLGGIADVVDSLKKKPAVNNYFQEQSNNSNGGNNNTMLYLGIGVVVAIVAFLIFKNK